MKRFVKATLKAIFCLLTISCFGAVVIKSEVISFQANPFTVLKSNGYKRVGSLLTKNGQFLGDIYVKENTKYTNHVLNSLLVVKLHGSKLDTLYQINSRGDFIDSNGKTEEKNTADNYYGFQLDKAKKGYLDVFSIAFVDSKGKRYSDDNYYLFDWNYKTKKFQYYPAP